MDMNYFRRGQPALFSTDLKPNCPRRLEMFAAATERKLESAVLHNFPKSKESIGKLSARSQKDNMIPGWEHCLRGQWKICSELWEKNRKPKCEKNRRKTKGGGMVSLLPCLLEKCTESKITCQSSLKKPLVRMTQHCHRTCSQKELHLLLRAQNLGNHHDDLSRALLH
uniref:RIKEN cDNA 4933402D24 gene n=1 Tax=Mus spicilegus TaxID=10103 RepID=A0A8C6MTD3_MUSSI